MIHAALGTVKLVKALMSVSILVMSIAVTNTSSEAAAESPTAVEIE